MIERTGDFVKHISREHNEVANDWADKVAKGERISMMTKKKFDLGFVGV